MRRRDLAAASIVAASWMAANAALAQAPSARPSASAAAPRASASAKPLASASASAAPSPSAPALPPGHPPMGDDDEEAPANPHAGATPGTQHGPEEPEVDPSLPPGTIAVDLRDPDDKPLASEPVTLGILVQSVAKGDSRSHRVGTTDAAGRATFGELDSGAGIAYRVSVVRDGATFAATPFQLPQGKGMRVTLRIYPVTRDIRQAFIGFEAIVYTELKDDRIQIQQAFRVYNLGKVAWVPDDVVISLPEGFTALNAQQSMSDQGIDPVEKRGARLRGTFPPGQHIVEYHWQLPWSGDKDVSIDIGLPPQVAVIRVMAAASQEMRLEVEGLPRAESRTDNQGQNILVTERRLTRGEEAMPRVHVTLRDLPTQGPGRFIATGLAALGVVGGLFVARGQRKRGARPADAKSARNTLLADLEELERAKTAGDVGPKTYERARRELIDALARTLAKGDA